MSALLSSIRQQATFAGNTRPGPEAPTAAPTTGTELMGQTGFLSELDNMVAGGIHPEMGVITQPASRAIERASQAIRGPHGGLIPKGPNMTGPAGWVARVRQQISQAVGNARS